MKDVTYFETEHSLRVRIPKVQSRMNLTCRDSLGSSPTVTHRKYMKVVSACHSVLFLRELY